MKSLNVLDAFSSAGCTKSFKFERVMIVQAHTHERENGRFFYFSKKKAVIYTKLLLFLEKFKKSSISPSLVCVWTIITLSNLKLLVLPADEKASKTFKLFI